MTKPLVSDELWAVVEPLLPPTRPPGTRGHPPVPNRVALTGIIFVLKTGIPWEYFPQELGCCGMTLWNRLRDWQRAGVWERLHHTLLQHLADAGRIDWRRGCPGGRRAARRGRPRRLPGRRSSAPRANRAGLRPRGCAPGTPCGGRD